MISVIIPACNEEDYIVKTISSISKDVEVIVVCNGCNDKTFDLVQGKVSKILDFKWRSVSRARNEGARIAKGSILVFLDADTILGSNVLDEIVQYNEFGLVGTCRVKPSCSRFKHRLFYFLKNKILCPFGVSNGIVFCTKETYDSVNGFNEDVFKREDGIFVRTIMSKGKFVILDSYVVNSVRRFESKGYFGMSVYWIWEALKPSKKEYEIVR